jgi:3'(2'), 5'-bisphosphate nucleotidase
VIGPLQQAAEVARDLVREAGRIVHAMQGTVDVRDKGGSLGPVTDADLAAERIVLEGLRASFPADPILSEESPERPASVDGRLWCVDPLDGTREYVKGLHEYAVMAGLLVDGHPAAGALCVPGENLMFWGWEGGGVFNDDGSVAMAPHHSMDDAVLVHSRSHRENLRRVVDLLDAGRTVALGGCGYKVTRLLLGEAHLYVHAMGGTTWWDSVAPAALVTAAGGHVGNAVGGALSYDGGIKHEKGLLFTVPGLGEVAAQRLAKR